MALPILDGNQSATTLSTIVTGGQHIPAHTVISLGSQAITDMRSAVSGSVVSISNFPATQPVSGTVTASLADQVTYSGTPIFVAAYVDSPGGSAIPVSQDTGGGMPISGAITASLFPQNGTAVQVDGGPSDTVGIRLGYNTQTEFIIVSDTAGLPIQGTVTANVPITTIGDGIGSYVGDYGPFPISGTVTANATVQNATAIAQAVIDESDSYGAVNVNIQSSSGNVAVVGTVTASNPSGALTTRFGSVTTANTAQLTSAVTNTSRKYLLVQNIATSTVTIGIGFAPTTTQGIQLTAGAGLTFDAFCPTGGVWWLSSATGSNFSILEG